MRRQQVALYATGKKLQGPLAFFPRCHALVLGCQALGDPLRQHAALDGVDLDRDAGALQSTEPQPGPRSFVQPRQQNQRERAVTLRRGGGQLLESCTAFLARFSGGYADFDNLLVGEQAQRRTCGQYRAPIKMRTCHSMYRAFAIPLNAGRRADGIGRFLHKQGFVAVQHIQRPQAFLKMIGQLGKR